MQAFIKNRIFIPKNNRCCAKHLIKKRLYDEELNKLKVYSNVSEIDKPELVFYLDNLSTRIDQSIHDKVGDFALSNEKLEVFTGLTWENILQLKEMLISMRSSEARNVTQALVTFLFKLRTGNSNIMLASILGLEYEQQVSNYCKSVIRSFEKDVLPNRFGCTAYSRDVLINNHTSVYVKNLHNIEGQLCIICDGTYVRHEKSSNNAYQRKSYSGQKKVPLCKPFTICTTDGFVIDVVGPFYATQNDATIMQIILSDPNGLRCILKKGDVFIVDRGFRDVKQQLEEEGFRVLMPSLKGTRSQLTTEESNQSRLVTKLRWVIEAVHGIIGKKYKLLHHQLDNKLLYAVSSYCKIACFLNNLFGERLNSDKDLSKDITEYIKSRQSFENSLARESDTAKWNRRKKPFQQLTSADIMDFPELSEKDLIIFFTGTYQLSQAVSYLAELMNQDNNINVNYLKEKPNIVRFEVRSRHINRKHINVIFTTDQTLLDMVAFCAIFASALTV